MLRTCNLCQKKISPWKCFAHAWHHHRRGELEYSLWHTEVGILRNILNHELNWTGTALVVLFFPLNWVLAILEGVLYPLALYREYRRKKRWEAERKEKNP